MAWVKLDDLFPDHPKVLQAGPMAAWLYVCGLTYANRHLTDGFIPDSAVPRLADLRNTQRLAETLVIVRLWERADGGYRIHDYLAYQPPASKVAQEREANAARVAAWKRRQRSTTNEEVTALPEHYSELGVMPLPKVPRKEEEEEPGPGSTSQLHNLPIWKDPGVVGAAAPPAAESSVDLLDRVNHTLTGQPGWEPTAMQLRKLVEIAERQDLDLELEALKIAEWIGSPKARRGGKQQQCSFRFVANWLEKNRPPAATNVNRTGPARASPPLSPLATLGADDDYFTRDWDAELGGSHGSGTNGPLEPN